MNPVNEVKVKVAMKSKSMSRLAKIVEPQIQGLSELSLGTFDWLTDRKVWIEWGNVCHGLLNAGRRGPHFTLLGVNKSQFLG